MAANAGETAASIETPSGGGALHGIGETFVPEVQMGTANVSIPLSLPSGRHGIEPRLALSYSSGAGNGPCGMGWSIGPGPITRRVSGGTPAYDASDTFTLAGADDLVPIPGGAPPGQRYCLRAETAFARIEHHVGPADDYWQVWAMDGSRTRYGTPGERGADPAALADPDDTSRIYAWYPTVTLDTFGNQIAYEYSRDDVRTDGPRRWDQLYLRTVRYADYGPLGSVPGSPSAPGATAFLVSVTFDYDARPDSFSQYRAGFEIRTVRRCSAISIATHSVGDAAGDTLARVYRLTYQDQVDAAAAAPAALTCLSLLARITVEGHDGSTVEALPPLALAYTPFDPTQRAFVPVTGPELPFISLARPGLELVDLFGSGLPDLLEMNGTVRYWRNQGGGRFGLPRLMVDAPAGVRLDQPGVQLIDANGDGRADLLVSTPPVAGYYPLAFDGGWDRRSFHRYATAPSFDLTDPSVRLIDLDGDGVTDALRTGARLECFFNDPDVGWTRTQEVERRGLDAFPDVAFTDPRVKLADLTGDGLQDIVLIHDRGIDYWPNLGLGRWGERVHMRHPPHFPYGYSPDRILLGDVDGDGVDDVVYVDDGQVTLWLNQTGNAWSDPIVVHGTPPQRQAAAVRLADVFGTGVRGILWTADADDETHASMFFLDFTGGAKPYLLAATDNGSGAITRLTYRPSTVYYVEDERHAATRWRTVLPFPVQVLARVDTIDQVSGGNRTAEYRYHHGYWDGTDREFRGFARVDERDSETFAEQTSGAPSGTPPLDRSVFSPPTETRTWFHIGPTGSERDGWPELDLRTEYWPLDPSTFERPPAMSAWLATLPLSARRVAIRALRGRILRSEMYVLDDDVRATRPVMVTENLHGIAPLPVGAPWPIRPEDWRLAAFFPHNLVQRTTYWERGTDPLTRLEFLGGHDAYGRATMHASMAVPRGRDFRVVAGAGSPYLVSTTRTDYATRDDATHYMTDRVARLTTWDVTNDGSATALALWGEILSGTAVRHVLSQQRHYYDGTAFVGQPTRVLGDFGALVRTEALALTTAQLRDGYRSGAAVTTPPEAPPYLALSGPPPWTPDYPALFRSLTASVAGYIHYPAGPDPIDVEGYFVPVVRHQYDFHTDPAGRGRGLVTVQRDAMGASTRMAFDAFVLLPIEVTDPVGLRTMAEHDYRVFRPRLITSENGNRQIFTYTPLGLLSSVAIMGKVTESVGDTPTQPSTRYVYDHGAFVAHRSPISVRTVKRVYHATDTTVSAAKRDETIDLVEYSDGFARLVQSRSAMVGGIYGDPAFGDAGLSSDQTMPSTPAVGHASTAAGPPRVLVSGAQRYDNKGRVVERYEPYFADGWDYAPPAAAEMGLSERTFYDGLGRPARTVHPDGSEQAVVHGIPRDLADPTLYDPTPWDVYTYDANDNAGRTHPAQSAAYATHWNTPGSITLDAAGRVLSRVERNGLSPSVWATTSSTFDAAGNVLTVTDALGRVAARHVYDAGGHALRAETADAGVRRTVFDARGRAIEYRDGRGALRLTAFDAAGRPTHIWARDRVGEPVTLRERIVYGDNAESGLSPTVAAARNLLGKPYRHYDEAGRVTTEHCDFRGAAVETTREVLSDATVLAAFTASASWNAAPFRADWNPAGAASLDSLAAAWLDPASYRTTTAFDALGRLRTMQGPVAVDGARHTTTPRYDASGALTAVALDGVDYVREIAHNARGQLLLIAYGNGLLTRFAYDSLTMRLARLRTEPATHPSAWHYSPAGAALQDYAYRYDLTGNLIGLADRTPASGIPGTALGANALDRAFTYDPLYRLLSATGRECDVPPPPAPWDELPPCTDPTRTRAYSETFTVDAVGNLMSRKHGAVQTFTHDPLSNRITTLVIGSDTYTFAYDDAGNLIREQSTRHLEWDYACRLRAFRTQTGAAEPSVAAHYFYDSLGQVVKKLVRKQGGQVEVTEYVAGIFERHRLVTGATHSAHDVIHVSDHQRDIALVRVGPAFPGDPTPAVTYVLADHLGSHAVIVGATGTFISREEFAPYGTTTFGRYGRPRYRYAGKERDDASGLYAYGSRWYAPWLARWTSCDPAGFIDGVNLYEYVRGSPMLRTDPSGTDSQIPDIPVPKDCKGNKCHTSYPSATPPPKWSDVPAPAEVGEWIKDTGVGITKAVGDFGITVMQGAGYSEGASAGLPYSVIKEGEDNLEKARPVPKNDAQTLGQRIIGPVLLTEAVAGSLEATAVKGAVTPETSVVETEVMAVPKPPLPVPRLPAPPPGKEVYINEYLTQLLEERAVQPTTQELMTDPATAFGRVPSSVGVPSSVNSPLAKAYAGYAEEYGVKLRVENDPFLSSVLEHVPKNLQRPGTGDFALREPFADWRLRPWDVTTARSAASKAVSGTRDYTYLTYELDWSLLKSRLGTP